MADVACYLLTLSNTLGIDLSDAVRPSWSRTPPSTRPRSTAGGRRPAEKRTQRGREGERGAQACVGHAYDGGRYAPILDSRRCGEKRKTPHRPARLSPTPAFPCRPPHRKGRDPHRFPSRRAERGPADRQHFSPHAARRGRRDKRPVGKPPAFRRIAAAVRAVVATELAPSIVPPGGRLDGALTRARRGYRTVPTRAETGPDRPGPDLAAGLADAERADRGRAFATGPGGRGNARPATGLGGRGRPRASPAGALSLVVQRRSALRWATAWGSRCTSPTAAPPPWPT